jgi:hypothetical protein
MRQSRPRRRYPGAGGTLYRCFRDRGGFGRAPPGARPRAQGIDNFDKEHNMSNNTEREGWSRNPATPQRVKPQGERYMQRVTTILSASALVLALSLPSWAQEKVIPVHTVTLAGTVETIDHGKRVVTIKTADGKFETIDVPESAKRFDELKVGDKVSITYNNNVFVRVKPVGEAPVDTAGKTSTMGQEARPGGTTSVQRQITATVDTIDKSASAITFVGPNGWKYSRHVVDPTVLDQVKVGDRVDITWSTDLKVTVE